MAGGATIYDLQGNATGFISAMQQASIQVNHFHQSTRNAAAGAKALESATSGISGGRGARAFLELSRGVEDAAVSFGTGGLQGAIRGSLNNISAMATMFGPLTGAIAGFAAAGTAALIPFFKDAGKEAEAAAERIDSMAKAAEKSEAFNARLRRTTTSQQSAGIVTSLEDEIAAKRAAERPIERSVRQRTAALQQIIDAENFFKQRNVNPFDNPFRGVDISETRKAALRDGLEQEGNKLQEIYRERVGLEEQLGRARRRNNQLLDEEIDKAMDALDASNERFVAGGRLTKREQENRDRLAGGVLQRLGANGPDFRFLGADSDISGRGTGEALARSQRFVDSVGVKSTEDVEKAIRDELAEIKKQTEKLEEVKKAIEKNGQFRTMDF